MNRNTNRIRYILPATTDFRETRPVVCWEHVYGWMEGYGVLFDPILLARFGNLIPEWENGWNGKSSSTDFVITACKQATAHLPERHPRGLYIRPSGHVGIIEHDRVSEKDQIKTPIGTVIYPVGYSDPLRYDRYAAGLGEWEIAESPALAPMGNGAVAVAFEFFSILSQVLNELPEKRLTHGADLLDAMIATTGVFGETKAVAVTGELADLRLDFQAYGVTRLMLQWLLDKKGVSRNKTAGADAQLLGALAAWQSRDAVAARESLARAFSQLAQVRQSASKLHLSFIEIPHMGILLEDKGWFELEWPQYARKTLEQYARWTETGYRLSIEAGASCWKNLSSRFPKATANIRQLWDEGKIELTNGTFSLPYSLVSPLLLQYWQFALGHRMYREVFGRVPKTYQAQEHALTPQMPELLKLFGYHHALHMAQNHGTAPAEDHDIIGWCSPAGHVIPSLAARHVSLSRKGVNYYLDLPLVHAEFGDREQEINYVNFMDLGFIPFRTQMVRAHAYAPVFGQYTTPAERFAAAAPQTESLPRRTYFADDYGFTPATFYQDHTNANALSQSERVVAMTHRLRQAQLASWLAAAEKQSHGLLAAIASEICLQEAHDVMLVQDQRQGEFYKFTGFTPPYSRDTLSQAVGRRATAAMQSLDEISATIGGTASDFLLNAAEVELGFARVCQPERFSGKLLEIGGETYAISSFAAWSAVVPDVEDLSPLSAWPAKWGKWTIHLGADGLSLQHGSRRVRVVPTDSALGDFRLSGAQASAAGSLLAMELTWHLPGRPAQTAVVNVLLTRDGSLAEISLSYSLGREFDMADRWGDCLALDVCAGEGLNTVWQFTPNVRSATREMKVNSPYFLAVESAGAEPLALLNEGASVYSVDRSAGTIRWYFHVGGERVLQRRMALAFGTSDAFQLSRAWSQGLLPVANVSKRQLQRWFAGGWEGLSAEGFTEDGRLLLSNLRATPLIMPVAADAPSLTVCGVDGKSRIRTNDDSSRDISLAAFELALLTLNVKADLARESEQKPYSHQRNLNTYASQDVHAHDNSH